MEPAEYELKVRFRDGDMEAAAELYRRYSPKLSKFIHSRPNMHHQRELDALIQDIACWTWHDALIGHASYEPDKKFVTWLYRIAESRAARALHARKGSTSIDMDRWQGGEFRADEKPIVRKNVKPGENPEPQPDAMPGVIIKCRPFDENGAGQVRSPNVSIFGGMELGLSHNRGDKRDERFIPVTEEEIREEIRGIVWRKIWNLAFYSSRNRFRQDSFSRVADWVESGRVKLTPLETEICNLLWNHVPKDEIASSLGGMNDVTLRKHFSNIGKKFRAVGKRIS